MDKNKNLTFTHISKEKRIILINSMKELQQAFNKKQQIIALDEKSKVINPNDDTNHHNEKIPKYFSEFKDQMLEFVKRQESFNLQVLEFIKEQRKFNQLILDRIDNLVKKNNLKE